MTQFKRILCPTDFSEPSLSALKVASELAAQFEATVTVLNVMPYFDTGVAMAPGYIPDYEDIKKGTQGQLRDLIAAYTRMNPRVRYEVDVRFGDPAGEIAEAANEGADLIVISTHGRTGWRHLVFGSVAEHVVRYAPCPVLTVRCNPPAEASATHLIGLDKVLKHGMPDQTSESKPAETREKAS